MNTRRSDLFNDLADERWAAHTAPAQNYSWAAYRPLLPAWQSNVRILADEALRPFVAVPRPYGQSAEESNTMPADARPSLAPEYAAPKSRFEG